MARHKKESLFRVDGANYLIPFILLTSLFLMWGLANNMTDTLLAAFKKIMSMSDFQTSWIQMAFYGSYFCLALPAALFIKRFNYKSGVLLGLGLFISGALFFYPASNTQQYGHFLAALFVLAGGLSVLETSANSYIIIMGPSKTATRRLNLAQSFNPIGSILGVALSKYFILANLHQAGADARSSMLPEQLKEIQTAELNAVMGPYVGIAIVLLLIWVTIAVYKMPQASDSSALNLGPTVKRLLRNRNYATGVVAQFFYVGAQIGVWSFTIRYVMAELTVNEEQASTYYIAALIAFTLSRFIFTGLMKYFKPGTLLAVAAAMAIVCSLYVIFGRGMSAVIALVAISAFMSLMFPTIFGQAVTGLGADTKVGGSGLIMAILGGAVLTALQGIVSDATNSIHYSFAIPLLCFIVILLYSINTRKYAQAIP
jgi:FHS family L-fucose permease-like MFS transporter